MKRNYQNNKVKAIRRSGLLLTFLFFVMIFFSANVAADDTVTVQVSGLYGQTEARSMLTRINDFRTGRYVDGDESRPWAYAQDGSVDYASYTNLGELQYDYDLEQAAMQRAMEIALQFSHTRPDNTSCYAVFPSGYSASGENIATGYGGSPDTAIEAFDQWAELDDPYEGQGHRRNMLSRNFNRIGIAFVKIHFNGKLTEGNRPYDYETDIYYWVQSLGRKTDSAGLTPTAATNSTMTKDVTVLKSNIEKAAIDLTKESLNINYGESYNFNDASSQIRLAETWPDTFNVRWSDGATSIGTYCVNVQGGYTLSAANSSIAGVSGKTITGNNAGNTTVTATSAFDSTAKGTVNVTVVPKSISAASVTTTPSSYQYTGSPITPLITVKLNETTLTSGTDYDASVTNNINAGTAQVTVTGKGNYKDSASGQFTITQRPIKSSGIIVESISPVVYNGEDQTPDPTVMDGNKALVKDTDYTLSYSNNKNAGQATVTISGTGNYNGDRTANFEIQKKPLTEEMVSLDKTQFDYNRQTQKPKVTVSGAASSDYTITNNGAVDCGENYEVVVTANTEGNLTGSVTKKYSITALPIGNEKITVDPISSCVYNGNAQTPKPVVKHGQDILNENIDYTVDYNNNVNAGNTARVFIRGIGNYKAARTTTFTISKKPISECTFNIETDTYVYNGSEHKPAVTIKDGEKELSGTTDYTVSYKNNIDAGTTATVTVTAEDNSNYSGSNSKTFTIDKKPITETMISNLNYSSTYVGKEQKAPVVVYDGTKQLKAGTDYTLTNAGGTNADDYNVKVVGKGNYTGEHTGTFKITKRTIAGENIQLNQSQYPYTGKPITPSVTYKDMLSSDCNITYNNTHTNVGEVKVTFTGNGKNCTGSVTKTYYITKANNKITKFTVKGGQIGGSQIYSWDLESTFGAKQAVIYFSTSANGSYTRTSPNKAGTYYMKAYIPGTSNYNAIWSTPRQFTITAAGPPSGKVNILNTIANSAKKTNDVIWDKSKVKNATNYEINWRARGASKWSSRTVGNVVRGTTTGLRIKGLYEIRVRPKNSFGGGTWSNSVYRYFHTTEKIGLKSSSKGSFTMSWKSNPEATGYQVMFTTNKNGSGAANNINTVGKSATSFTKKGLKSGTTYYVQVRELKNVGGINYIGNISCPLAVKVK